MKSIYALLSTKSIKLDLQGLMLFLINFTYVQANQGWLTKVWLYQSAYFYSTGPIKIIWQNTCWGLLGNSDEHKTKKMNKISIWKIFFSELTDQFNLPFATATLHNFTRACANR
jgi:hypothetical protein